jgi:hypothetical protein
MRKRLKGARVLPYVDGFLLFTFFAQAAIHVSERLVMLGLLRHPNKLLWEPTHFGHHLDINIYSAMGYFFAPADKLQNISTHARHMIGRANRNSRWLPVRDLQFLAWQAQYGYVYPRSSLLSPRVTLCHRRHLGWQGPDDSTTQT